jgi:hypothetical protein
MEPERRIEKLLRAFAKKRREQAGDAVELRPAARQRLQREISRRSAGQSGGGIFSNFFAAFRPKLAFALCFIALICVGGWLLAPILTGEKSATLGAGNSQLAKASLPEPATPVLTPAPPVTASPPAAEAENRNVFKDKNKAISDAIVSKPAQPSVAGGDRWTTISGNGTFASAGAVEHGLAPTNAITVLNAPSAPPSNTETLALRDDRAVTYSFGVGGAFKKDMPEQPSPASASQVETNLTASALVLAAREPETQKTLAMEKAPAALPPAGALFDANLKAESTVAAGAFISQHFYRLDMPTSRQRAARALSVPGAVLSSFQVEQHGDEIRVVDADGSVYIGTIHVARNESAPLAALPAKFQNESAAVSSAKTRLPTPAVQNYFFRVAGTNHNLRQNIVFSGNFIPLTNALYAPTNAGGFGGGGGAGTRRAMPDSLSSSLLSNSRISGKVAIGNQKEIEVNATPAPQ